MERVFPRALACRFAWAEGAALSPGPLDIALDYLGRGWSPVPVPTREKAPVIAGWQKALVTTENAPNYFNGRAQNIGVLLGEPSGGLVDVDCDCDTATALARHLLPATDARFGRVGNPLSHHLYVVTDKKTARTEKFVDPNKPKDEGMIIELRATGGQTVFPGSIHQSGEAIEWAAGGAPAEMPYDALLWAVRKIAAATVLAPHWVEKVHDELAAAVAGTLLRARWSEADVTQFISAIVDCVGDAKREKRLGKVSRFAELLRDQGDDAHVPGLARLRDTLEDEKTFNAFVKWLELRGTPSLAAIRTASPYLPNDTGNARRFLDQHRENVRYVIERETWITCTEENQRWRECPQGLTLLALIKGTLTDALKDEVAAEKNPRDQQNLARWLVGSLNTGRLESALGNARSEPGIAIGEASLDARSQLVGVANGVVDLQTCTHRAVRRDDYNTRSLGTRFDAAARCPKWLAALEDMTGAGEAGAAMRKYLQVVTAITLLGNSLRILVFIYGSSGTGKTVFIEVLKALFGEYGVAAKTEVLMTGALRSRHGPSEELARLAGTRFVAISETGVNDSFDEALIKDVTGGDTITARRLYRPSFEFRPEFVVWVRGNHKPRFAGNDAAMLERLRLVPFEHRVPPEKRNAQLRREIVEDELPGVLNWVLDGVRIFREEGLVTPKIVTDSTKEYAREMDLVGQFVEDKCFVGPGQQVGATDLYNVFVKWCRDQGIARPWSQRGFGLAMTERGFKKDRIKDVWHYFGIRETF